MTKNLLSIITGFAAVFGAIIKILEITKVVPITQSVPIILICTLLAVFTIYLQWESISEKIVGPVVRRFSVLQSLLPFIALFFFLIFGYLIRENKDLKINSEVDQILSVVFLFLSIILLTLIFLISQYYKDVVDKNKTVYVGTFPSNIHAIIELINKSKSELLIAVDFPAYGCFSNPDDHANYKKSIEEKMNGDFNAKIISYNKKKAFDASDQQFKEVDINSPLFRKKADTYNRYHKAPENWVDLNRGFQNVVDVLLKQDERFVENLRNRGVDFKFISDEIPIYMWISDNKKAIFSFYNLQGESSEVSFLTKDYNLVQILKSIFFNKIDNSDDKYGSNEVVSQSSSTGSSL